MATLEAQLTTTQGRITALEAPGGAKPPADNTLALLALILALVAAVLGAVSLLRARPPRKPSP